MDKRNRRLPYFASMPIATGVSFGDLVSERCGKVSQMAEGTATSHDNQYNPAQRKKGGGK